MPGRKLRFDNPEGEQLLKDIEEFETKRIEAMLAPFRFSAPDEWYDKNYVSIEVPGEKKDGRR